ncbi:acetyltransferase [Ferruginibacter paludis]|uniref:acetyltransferase n=1 Tax=Ferruginibacter paludis TaxID=1310417 RepID=UPI0025B5DEAF|nr:acetyltransferase [Ferruginibacter paludis]MDN3658880.1 acetyltransferase [Ferruginibacter paludis]
MKDIAIYGAGGFGREIACLIKAINELQPQWNLLGFVDDGVPKDTANRYGKVLGDCEWLNNYDHNLSVAIAIANPQILRSITARLTNVHLNFPNIIAPTVSFYDKDSFQIGKGNIIFFGCRFSCDVQIGDFNLFNGFVALGHDVRLGSYNILNPSVRLSGDVIVGDGNFFGVQSIILQGKKIGNQTKIGVNSVIMRNTKDGYLYHGNPAKIVVQ